MRVGQTKVEVVVRSGVASVQIILAGPRLLTLTPEEFHELGPELMAIREQVRATVRRFLAVPEISRAQRKQYQLSTSL